MDFRLELKGGCCANRYLDREAPEAFKAAGFDDQSWGTVNAGLGSHMSRYYQDNFVFVCCATFGSIPILIFAIIVSWPILLLLVPLWGVYFTSLFYQERYTIPRRLSNPIGMLNERLFNPKGLELSYKPGLCFGSGACFLVTTVKSAKPGLVLDVIP